VSINYQRFKDIFMSKREKVPKPVARFGWGLFIEAVG
jgi:hypothetical protein